MVISEGNPVSVSCGQSPWDSIKIETDPTKIFTLAEECEEENPKRALSLYKMAEENGSVAAITRQGILYLNGRGDIRKDELLAFRYFTIAADNGDAEANACLGKRYMKRRDDRAAMDRAFEQFERAAQGGSIEGTAWLGRWYLGSYDQGHKDGLTKGLRLVEKAAELGNANGLYFLGRIYSGKWQTGIEKDTERAKQLFLQAADLGHAKAMYQLGKMFHRIDDSQSKLWYMRASDRNQKKAIEEVAVYLSHGMHGFPLDPGKAFRYYQKLVDLGPPSGPRKSWRTGGLAYMYKMGIGCIRDQREGRRFWHLDVSSIYGK